MGTSIAHSKGPQNQKNPELPSITLSDGETIRADVVVGADGLHSIACETVIGRKNEPVPPAHYNCCYRFL